MLPMLMPLLILILITLVFVGLMLSWEFKRTRNHKVEAPWIETRNDLQMWLLVLAAFIAGVFLAYILFVPPPGNR